MTNPPDSIPRFLSAANRQMAAYMARRLEPLGLGSGQYSYLFALYREDGQTQQALADLLMVDKSAVVGAINRLERLGYLERRSAPGDRRSFRIHLTEKGWAIRPQLEAVVEEVQEAMLEGLPPDDRAALFRLLSQVKANLSAALRP
ncbi:MAG: MarR family winged helix-turn-helix transcriptional regulator [Bacillota bacterium]